MFKYLITFLICCFFASSASAAVLYFDSERKEFAPGQTVVLRIMIDTEGECINAASVKIDYDNSVLKFIDFSKGESLISFWVENPVVNEEQGAISFGGGVPGGYCGKLAGEMGNNNILGRVIFQIPSMLVLEDGKDSFDINFSSESEVFLNDGLGTKAELGFNNLSFTLSEDAVSQENIWKQEILDDVFPPEQFEISILTLEKKNFVVFQTTDKQTGIDHYEIKEGENGWKFAESPYLLENQKIQSIIRVRAIDKAGNERISEYVPEIPREIVSWQVIVLILIGFGGIILLIYSFYRLRRK